MQISKVGIIGAGTMGSGIAQICAMSGVQVTMLDISETALSQGVSAVDRSLERLISKGQLDPDAHRRALDSIKTSTDHACLADMDLVIEAATENLDLKLRILSDVAAVVRDDALVATNTSSLSITRLAASVKNPERFIGMHFFNPVPIMMLVELIRGIQTSDEALSLARGFAESVQRVPIIARNSAGFAVNRILVPMINEAIFVFQEGVATAEDIDTGMRLGCNHPVGPLALADLIGLDVVLAVMEVLYEAFKDSKYRPAPLLREMVDAGHLGRKSRKGFYTYP
ncbi:3-hydroxybutyryl-CoA dehydrogenase [Stutzerimonas xanthomarina]|jgi:3-hydroxybutyryl-CoA dehydrogenase|uniref:3-hydroxybutyryl-CoA dehydrogenase n=1 Tax=Stutzerimonas xanthomarina TaxID=271420 RepID=A0A427E0W8_9GAMM|nr:MULTISPECIES: 3-hydroxybutyryl-CoA dehydrogenase [Stutzerimonas]MCW8158344.1 3-hydroxybutyryl-CoA dehydrogenase [Stutzerimonas stutzeri]RRV09802.1 3-hydroxybutyryl-CoA dehydrogenase [Stutzerimonas xanthomarina]